jgi:WhiB family transcriptional regulator, redox-sensing transcriptional regulator
MNWREIAACRGTELSLWFAPDRIGDYQAEKNRVARAVHICGSCPVVASCRDYAVETECGAGIWGGMDVHQRRQYARKTR